MNGFLLMMFGLGILLTPCMKERKPKDLPVGVPPAVANCVKVILDATLEVEKAHRAGRSTKQQEYRLEELVGKLTTDKTSVGDEALVVLIQFYIGEATGEDIDHETTTRGRRMLPYLRKYRQGPAQLPGRAYPDWVRRDTQAWRDNIDRDVESIQKGKVLFEN